jgi:hypothetical protein
VAIQILRRSVYLMSGKARNSCSIPSLARKKNGKGSSLRDPNSDRLPIISQLEFFYKGPPEPKRERLEKGGGAVNGRILF